MSFSEEIKTTAIVGTAQKELNLSSVGGKLDETLAKLDRADRERFLLSSAAVAASHQTAGKVLSVDRQNAPEIAEAETREILSGQAKQLYETLLNNSDKSLLPEFLELMRQRRKIIPPELLPLTFALANTHLQIRGNDYRHQILPVVGNRGKWLARQMNRWLWVLVEDTTEKTFETGSSEERIFALEYLRRKDADKARELLQKSWNSEAAKDRQKFLEVLEINLSESDEGFLDEILRNDKSSEVRQTAFDLLASLPDSKLVGDSTAQIWQILNFSKGGILRKAKIEIEFPVDFDSKEYAYFSFPKAKTNLGRKGWKFVQILGAVSLKELEKCFSVTALDFVNAAKNNPWTLELFLGLSAAAVRQKNSNWFEALLYGFKEKENVKAFEGKYQSRNDFTENLRQAAKLIPKERVELFANHFLLKNEPLHDDHAAFYFLKGFEKTWSDALSENFLNSIKQRFSVQTKRTKDERIWELLSFLPKAATLMAIRFGAKNVFGADEDFQPEALKKLREFEETLKLRFEINKTFENEG